MNSKPILPGLLLATFLTLALAAGCSSGGGDGGNDPGDIDQPTTAAQYTARGWEGFEAGQYATAIADFEAALALDSTYGEARAGRAWSRLVQAEDESAFAASAADFQLAVMAGEGDAYVRAGWACALLGQEGQLSAAAAQAESALASEPSFIFAHRISFNAVDARLALAFALAGQGSYSEALAQGDLISDSGIDIDEAGTWEVDGTAYFSFPGAVLAHLHKLSTQYSG